MRSEYLLFVGLILTQPLFSQMVALKDVYPEKARYFPKEPVRLQVEIQGVHAAGQVISAGVTDLGEQVGSCGPTTLTAHPPSTLLISCSIPPTDFRGYLVTVEIHSADGRTIDSRETALDISSDWKRFPRYGYLAHYNDQEGARPAEWIADLNRFHIDGLEFYDFQYHHDQPLAGTVQQPAATWKDIAGRKIDASIVSSFIDEAHARNMMAMAYNASYSAYDDAFTRAQPLPLRWATWTTADGPRTAQATKNLPMHISGGSTSKLYYMNQNDIGWQNYLFHQMHRLFDVYPFDGWHVDTFGDNGGYAFDRSPVNYIAGFKQYIDHAHAALQKRVVFNAVNTWGQDKIANSDADFVYSELWEDHETFASILDTAEQVHIANPTKAYVIAAYLHRNETKDGPRPQAKQFNPTSVLLTDAAIFASGAAHIELGDGDRMLSSEYFPSDTHLTVSPELRESLRRYYDFLTAYEVYLRDQLTPAAVAVAVEGEPVDALGVPNTLWSIARQRDGMTVIHLINLLGSEDPHWRDISMSRPDAPHLHDLHVKLALSKRVRSIGWASPDVDGGSFHVLTFQQHSTKQGDEIGITLPQLHYWDTIFIKTEDPKPL
jgi:dextranase